MNSTKIGIIGAGKNTREKHIPLFKEIEGVEIQAVTNRTPGSSKKVANEFAITEVYEHWQAMVEDPEIDAILIGTWPYMHAPITLYALKNGKHVLTEARMCMNYAEAQSMYFAHLDHPELVAQIVPSPYTLEVDLTIKRLITSGQLGKLLAVRVDDFGSFLPKSALHHWRNNRKYSGLNTLALGIYYEALARWVGHVQWVQAHSHVFLPRLMDGSYEVTVSLPDYLSIQGEFPGEIMFNMNLSPHIAYGPRSGFYIFGSEATLFFNLKEKQLYMATRGQTSMELVNIPENEKRGWQVEADFITSIRNHQEALLTSFFEGMRYMAFTEAVHISAQTGRRIWVPQSGEDFS
jgi:predicted dehydrogenase